MSKKSLIAMLNETIAAQKNTDGKAGFGAESDNHFYNMRIAEIEQAIAKVDAKNAKRKANKNGAK